MQYIWCRFDDCGKPYESHAGDRPRMCPACQRPAHWATDPSALTVNIDGAIVFTPADLKFLARIEKGQYWPPGLTR